MCVLFTKKPSELIEQELRDKARKQREDRQFFAQMEHNIVQSQARGEVMPGIPYDLLRPEGSPKEPRKDSQCEQREKEQIPSHKTSPRVRTISGMDEVLLAKIRVEESNTKSIDHTAARGQRILIPPSTSTRAPQQQNTPSVDKSGRPPLPGIHSMPPMAPPQVSGSMPVNEEKVDNSESDTWDYDLAGLSLVDEPLLEPELDLGNTFVPEKNTNSHPRHARRNTGSAIPPQVSTMERPDIDATIKCVCGVFLAHISEQPKHLEVEEAKQQFPSDAIFKSIPVFDDDYSFQHKLSTVSVPSLVEVIGFYHEFFKRAQMEQDSIIMSLIYVERLIKASNGTLSPNPRNWRSILFSCMCLASKVWDDLSMNNTDFSTVSASTTGLRVFTLSRINELELALLKCLEFNVRVPASEYAKYYFLIRSMLLRAGMVQEGASNVDGKVSQGKLALDNNFNSGTGSGSTGSWTRAIHCQR